MAEEKNNWCTELNMRKIEIIGVIKVGDGLVKILEVDGERIYVCNDEKDKASWIINKLKEYKLTDNEKEYIRETFKNDKICNR